MSLELLFSGISGGFVYVGSSSSVGSPRENVSFCTANLKRLAYDGGDI